MPKASNRPPQDKLELYDRLIDGHPEVSRKGAASPYTSHNGNMFTYLSKEGVMGLRLAASDRNAFLAQFETVLFEQYGSVMKEYVTVPDSLLADAAALRPYLEKSWDYVQSLKPKPTTRKKKS